MDDLLGAFCKHCDLSLKGPSGGTLGDLTFAAKDNYALADIPPAAAIPTGYELMNARKKRHQRS
jgi:hypothetical protein